jgi:Holliday junction resolvase
MSEEQAVEVLAEAVAPENKLDIDYKEVTRLLLFAGMVPAAKYIVAKTPNKIDDTTVEVIDKLGKFLLGGTEIKAE